MRFDFDRWKSAEVSIEMTPKRWESAERCFAEAGMEMTPEIRRAFEVHTNPRHLLVQVQQLHLHQMLNATTFDAVNVATDNPDDDRVSNLDLLRASCLVSFHENDIPMTPEIYAAVKATQNTWTFKPAVLHLNEKKILDSENLAEVMKIGKSGEHFARILGFLNQAGMLNPENRNAIETNKKLWDIHYADAFDHQGGSKFYAWHDWAFTALDQAGISLTKAIFDEVLADPKKDPCGFVEDLIKRHRDVVAFAQLSTAGLCARPRNDSAGVPVMETCLPELNNPSTKPGV